MNKIVNLKEDGKLPNDFEWNDGYILEGMDRIHTVQVIIDSLIVDHPSIVLLGLQKDISKVQRKLNKIYQAIGGSDG